MFKKKEKTEETNARVERQLELLSKYGSVDKENKIITTRLHYDNVNELLQNDISTKDNPVVSEEVLDKADSIIDRCPPDYRSAVEVQINDFDGYDPKKIVSSFNETMELEHYRTVKQGRKSWYIGALLCLVGIGLLIFLNVLKVTGAIGEEKLEDLVIDYVIDTFACVFIWECLSALILYPPEFYKRNNKVYLHFAGITLLDSEGNIVAKETKEEMITNWVDESGRKKTGKAFLMFTGTAMIAIGTIAVVSTIITTCKYAPTATLENIGIAITTMVIALVIGIAEILSGIGSINMVRERGPFRKFVKFVNICLLVLYCAFIGSSIYTGITIGTKSIQPGMIVTIGFGIIFVILILIGYHYSKEKDIKHFERKELEKAKKEKKQK